MTFTFFKPKMPSVDTSAVSSPVIYPSVTSQFEAANQKFAATFTQSHLPGPPRRKVAVVACMDSRLDVERVLGLDLGDAHVIRNAGGRAVEALRSILISQQLLGTREIIIMHHTGCGMQSFSDTDFRAKIRQEMHEDVDHMAFLPFSDLRQSVIDDVAFLRKSPLILDVPINGYVYDVKTGRIEQVDERADSECSSP
ncbi:carbonic anhydrase [Fusarium sporotrichioides]|uniref:Carbonic anhydrase n=1 Tax=Fusarium sporotrichioides TaxID=5514 RepID=A0A395SCK8_FUSSP|nr:carbonic anhydrase [Fusarium sporotrichioides]